MQILRQSTAFTFRIGPFVDSTDGVTAETGLTISQADIQISKAGGAFAQTSDASPTTTHDTDGWYQCPLTATDTNTLGTLDVQVTESGALPVWRHFMVVPANVYDSLVAGSDALQVHANEMTAGLITASVIATGAIDADALAADAITAAKVAADVSAEIADAVWDETQAGHVGAGTFGEIATEIASILVDTAEIGAAGAGLTAVPWNSAWDAEVQSEVNDGLVALGLDHLVSAAVAGADVTDNSIVAYLASKSATADWDSYVNTTDALEAIADSGGGGPTAAQIADAVWDEAQADHVGAGTFGETATEIASILSDTGTDGVVVASGSKTGYTLSAAGIQAVFNATMTEDYAADGTAFTLAQGMYEICQSLTEFAISSTTLTVKQRDGSTAAMTFTLDDADSPTSRTRAT